jgi:hypothetical protein
MLHVEDWAEIRRLRFAEGMAIKQIARQLRISKNTVKAKLAADTPPKYERAPVGSVVDEVEPRARECSGTAAAQVDGGAGLGGRTGATPAQRSPGSRRRAEKARPPQRPGWSAIG